MGGTTLTICDEGGEVELNLLSMNSLLGSLSLYLGSSCYSSTNLEAGRAANLSFGSHSEGGRVPWQSSTLCPETTLRVVVTSETTGACLASKFQESSPSLLPGIPS